MTVWWYAQLIFAGITVICPTSCLAQSGKYRNHQFAWIYPASSPDVSLLNNMRDKGLLEVWNENTRRDNLSPLAVHLMPGALQILDEHNLLHSIVYKDMERMIEDEHLQAKAARYSTGDVFDRFLTFNEILDYMDELAEVCGDLCTVIDIGSSWEGRPLRLIRISGAYTGVPKQSMWIDAGIHSREWISHATALYLLTRLIEDYDSDPYTRHLVDTYDWYILPVVNPDGYEYTWTDDRLWRKSRRPNPGSQCVGTDLNRNFDFQWMTIGASNDPCSNTFAGQKPYSDPEPAAVSDFILSRNGTWALFITLHSKGQLFMAPWGYTSDPPRNAHQLGRVGMAAVKAIEDTHGQIYQYGSASDILYLSSGTSRDWAAGAAHIPYVYTIELRDTGNHGWILPPENIRPTGQEIWAAVRAVVAAIEHDSVRTARQQH